MGFIVMIMSDYKQIFILFIYFHFHIGDEIGEGHTLGEPKLLK